MSENATIHRGAFLVNSLAVDQKTFLMINCINKIVKNGLSCVSVFRRNLCILPCRANFGIFEAKHAPYFKSPVIATDIFSAKDLVNTSSSGKRYFYVWDLDWLYKAKQYTEYEKIYKSDLQLIARCKEHADLIEQCWQTPTQVIEDFNYEKIIRIFA